MAERGAGLEGAVVPGALELGERAAVRTTFTR